MQKLLTIIQCAILSTLFVCQESAAQESNVVDEVVWIVGDEAILKSQVEEQYRQMQYEGQRIDGDPYCVIPEQIALQKLFLHQAEIDSITVTDAQVFQTVEARLNSYIANIGSKEKLEEYFDKPMSVIREEMAETVREQGIVQQMRDHLVKDVKLTPAEVRRLYNEMPQDSLPFVPTQVEVQIITRNPEIPQQEIDNIKARLREFTERVNNGESEFSTLAVLYSEDPGSARMGGELGFLGKGSLIPEFANVAFNLTDPTKVSKIVETEYGYHIIQLIEKRGDRINVRHILLKPKVSEMEKTNAIAQLDSIRIKMNTTDHTFEDAVPYISQDKDTRNNRGVMVNAMTRSSQFEMQALPQEIAKVVSTMQVNDISEPFVMINEKQGKEVVAMVKLTSRTEGHKANMKDDYQTIKALMENQKKEQIIKDWIVKKQSQIYINIKEDWRKGDFKYDGWIKE